MTVLTQSWRLGPLTVPNRVVLAPLAGIGNWFVRLQARRYGAGMAFSEMVSSFAVHYGNERTLDMLRVHPDEGVVALQLFGQDPDVMRSAAAIVADRTDVDALDLNMGCPVPKVCKTGAGAALLDDPDRAVAVARAAVEGSGLPVTVKLRSGRRIGEDGGFRLAQRLADEAGVAAISFHPRSASVHHKGMPDYDLAARLVASLPVPVILSGGLRSADAVRAAHERTGAAAVMLARGSLGNPWLFAELLEGAGAPTPGEVVAEWEWVLERAVEHMEPARAARYLRKFHPWYVERLGLERGEAKALLARLQLTESIDAVRAAIAEALGVRQA